LHARRRRDVARVGKVGVRRGIEDGRVDVEIPGIDGDGLLLQHQAHAGQVRELALDNAEEFCRPAVPRERQVDRVAGLQAVRAEFKVRNDRHRLTGAVENELRDALRHCAALRHRKFNVFVDDFSVVLRGVDGRCVRREVRDGVQVGRIAESPADRVVQVGARLASDNGDLAAG